MAEWSKAGALKASEGQLSGGSNPSLSAKSLSLGTYFFAKTNTKIATIQATIVLEAYYVRYFLNSIRLINLFYRLLGM